jgi:hypothetical protein
VVVVCNQRPTIAFEHPHVHYLEVDFPPPLLDPEETLGQGYEYSHSQDIARKNADKARKIWAGLDYAQRFAPTHAMMVDADDCVSCRLAEFVDNHAGGQGWYFKTGYFHTEGSRFLFLNRQNFNVVCGTSVIIAYERREILFANRDFYHHAFYEPPPGLVPLPFVCLLPHVYPRCMRSLCVRSRRVIRTCCKRPARVNWSACCKLPMSRR